MNNKLIIALLACTTLLSAQSTQHIKLWKDEPAVRNNHAELLVYPAPAENNTGTAVIICPGGSYHHLGIPHEGILSAKWFNTLGISAYVLRYRVSVFGYHHPAMIEDFQRAMQLVRENADANGLTPQKVGAIGFSAGGHLVLMGGEFADTDFLARLGIHTNANLQPDWVASIYPVISMQDSIAHLWSRQSLWGTKHATQAQKDSLSLEMHVPSNMPPVFLQASTDDPVVDVRNSMAMHKALTEQNAPHLFKLYPTGGHGYGMKDGDFMQATHWNEALRLWLQSIQILPTPQKSETVANKF